MMSDPAVAVAEVPYSREAEEAVIGSVLINADVYYDLAQFLKPNDFYIHRLRFIWESYVRLQERRVPVDSLTVSEELDNMGHLEEIGGQAYLTALLNQVPTTLHAEAYGKIIEATSIRRKLLAAANSIATLAYDADEAIETVMGKAQEHVLSVVASSSPGQNDVSAHDAASDLYDLVVARARSGLPPGILTGHKDLDALTGGLCPGVFLLTAGRPGSGKSALLLTWLAFMMTRAKPPRVVLDQMEMPSTDVMARLVAIITGLDTKTIRDGTLSDDEWPLFDHGIEVVSSWPLLIIDERDPQVLFNRATRWVAMGECDLLIADYIGKFEAKAENRVRQVAVASNTLAKLAKQLNIPVVAAAQVSREIDRREAGSRLVLADLKESGDLEQDAHVVLFLDPDTENPNLRHGNVAKNRNGPVGNFDLYFKPQQTKFESVARGKT